MDSAFFRKILSNGNLTITQYKILMLLSTKEATIGEISADLDVSRVNIVIALKELIKMNLIIKKQVCDTFVYSAIGSKSNVEAETLEIQKATKILKEFHNLNDYSTYKVNVITSIIGTAMISIMNTYIGVYYPLKQIDKICCDILGNKEKASLYNNFALFVDNDFVWKYRISNISINVHYRFKDIKFANKLINDFDSNSQKCILKKDVLDSFSKNVCITDIQLMQ